VGQGFSASWSSIVENFVQWGECNQVNGRATGGSTKVEVRLLAGKVRNYRSAEKTAEGPLGTLDKNE